MTLFPLMRLSSSSSGKLTSWDSKSSKPRLLKKHEFPGSDSRQRFAWRAAATHVPIDKVGEG